MNQFTRYHLKNNREFFAISKRLCTECSVVSTLLLPAYFLTPNCSLADTQR